MAIAFRAAGTVVTGDDPATLTPTAPAGTVSTDVVLAVFMFKSGGSLTTIPAGWTLAASVDNATSGHLAVYWGLGSATFGNWGPNNCLSTVAFTVGYTGVNNTTPMDATGVGQANASSTTTTAPSITTVTDNALLVGVFGTYDSTFGTVPTWSAEFGTHRINSGFVGSTSTVDADVADAVQASLGSSGTKTATLNKSLPNIGILLALRPVIVGPTITSQPQNARKYPGDTATFSVSATSSGGSLTYQWQKDDGAGGAFSDISSATSSSYTTATLTQSDDNYRYRCNVTDSNGTVASSIARLGVDALLAATNDIKEWFDPDLVDLASSGTTYSGSVTEAVTASESESATAAFASSIAESVTASESESATAIFASSITESASATESEAATAVYASSIAETVSATETESATVVFASSITESVSATDSTDASLVVPVAESVAATDSTDATAAFVADRSESVSAAASQDATAVFAASDTESVAASDVESATAVFAASDTEAVAAASTQSATLTFAASEAESVAATDAESATAVFAASDTEPVAASDAGSATAVFASSDAEAVAASDAESATAVFAASDTEAVAAASTQSATAQFAASVTESVAPSESSNATISSGSVTHQGAITESVAASDASSAELVHARRSRPNPWAKFTPYAEANVAITSVVAVATVRQVKASAERRSTSVAVSVLAVAASVAVRTVRPASGSGAHVSVTPVAVVAGAAFAAPSWRGEQVAPEPLVCNVTVSDVSPRTGSAVRLTRVAATVADAIELTVSVRTIRNPTDEELAAMALAARVAMQRRRASIRARTGGS